MAEAIRQELLSLLAEPLTLKQIGKVKRIAEAGHRMLVARSDSTSLQRLGSFDGLNEAEEYTFGGPVFGNQETYGATVVRELVTAAAGLFKKEEKKEDPAELVRAIAEARNAKLPEVEALLRARLAVLTAPAAQPVGIPPSAATPPRDCARECHPTCDVSGCSAGGATCTCPQCEEGVTLSSYGDTPVFCPAHMGTNEADVSHVRQWRSKAHPERLGCESPGCTATITHICNCNRCRIEDPSGQFHTCDDPAHQDYAKLRHERIYPSHTLTLVPVFPEGERK